MTKDKRPTLTEAVAACHEQHAVPVRIPRGERPKSLHEAVAAALKPDERTGTGQG